MLFGEELDSEHAIILSDEQLILDIHDDSNIDLQKLEDDEVD